MDNQTRAAEGQIANQDVYLTQMTDAHQKFAQGQIDAANAGASQAAGGVNRGTSITIGGINQGAALEQRANKITFDGSVKQPARCGMPRSRRRGCTRSQVSSVQSDIILRVILSTA